MRCEVRKGQLDHLMIPKKLCDFSYIKPCNITSSMVFWLRQSEVREILVFPKEVTAWLLVPRV